MQGPVLSEASPGQIAIAGEMTIFFASDLKPALLDGLTRNSALQLDLSGVSEIDCAGVQLLVLLQREAASQNKAVNLTHHSQAVTRVLGLLGLERSLGESISIVWS